MKLLVYKPCLYPKTRGSDLGGTLEESVRI